MCKVDRMRNWLLLAVIGAGCGDNSKACGPGTVDDHGTCVPAAGCGVGTMIDEDTGQCVPDPMACGPGTLFDPLTGTCKIDPASCQNGTVLIDNACVDPAVGLVIDVQEGPEPNGLGVVEASGAQAGNITLKPVGMAYVIHGTLAPWRDANLDGALDPDVDTYVVTVTRPVLLEVSADGLGGVLAGFVANAAVAAGNPLETWRRAGIHLIGDTSRRQLLLPSAGTYRLAIADTRTLTEYLATAGSTAATSGDYYVSIRELAAPLAIPLSPTGSTIALAAALPADTLGFYEVPLGTGSNTVSVVMPSELATGAAVVLDGDTFRGAADEPGTAVAGGITAATSVVVVDHAVNLTAPSMDFTLSITIGQ